MLGVRFSWLGLVLLVGCLSGCGGASSSAGNQAGGGSGSSSGSGTPTTQGDVIGDGHPGQYHLGPVDFAETQWHNACAPGGSKYPKELQPTVGLSGEYLAGVANAFNMGGAVCDACILIETDAGQSIIARVVTFGVENADGDIDVSPNVYDTIYQNEYPRSQTWHFARCPDEGGLVYEYQTEANPYWTSLWVRNPRVPITKAEVKTSSGKDFVELRRGTDGSLTLDSGFGNGAFTLRFTGMDGQVITDQQPGFTPGALVETDAQFE